MAVPEGYFDGYCLVGHRTPAPLDDPSNTQTPQIAQIGATWLSSKQCTSPTTAGCQQNPRFLRFRRHFWLKALRRWLLGLSLLT